MLRAGWAGGMLRASKLGQSLGGDLLQLVERHGAPTSSSKVLVGSVKRNVEPVPMVDAAVRRPPCASTRPRLIQRPSPEPVGRVWARRKNLVKMRGRSDD